MKTIFDVIKEIDTAEDARQVLAALYSSAYFDKQSLPIELILKMDGIGVLLAVEAKKERQNFLTSLPEPNEDEKNGMSIIEAIKAYRLRTGVTSLRDCKEVIDLHWKK